MPSNDALAHQPQPRPVRQTGSPSPQPSGSPGGAQTGEITGLGTAIDYAGAQRQAAEHNAADVEAWLESLQGQDVSGEVIAAALQVVAHLQAAAAAFAQAEAALTRHQQVGEAYHANLDAGTREFVTAEETTPTRSRRPRVGQTTSPSAGKGINMFTRPEIETMIEAVEVLIDEYGITAERDDLLAKLRDLLKEVRR
jgi:hypothetical protein